MLLSSVLASIFKIRIKDDLLGIFIGNPVSGYVMITVSMNVAEGASIELLLTAIVVISIEIYTINRKKRINKEKMTLDYEAEL